MFLTTCILVIELLMMIIFALLAPVRSVKAAVTIPMMRLTETRL
jgi:hypothetical protein